MMKKLFLIVGIVLTAMVFINVPVLYAALIPMDDGSDYVLYDDVNQRYWVQALSMFTYQDYQQQLQSIDGLNSTTNAYFSLNGWHLATYDEMVAVMGAYDSEEDVFTQFNPSYAGVLWPGQDPKDFYNGRYELAPSWSPEGAG